jgi:hypothetical protein
MPSGLFNPMMRIRPAPLAAVVLLPAIQSLAHAEAGNPLTDTFSLDIGTFFVNTSTRLAVDGHGIRGTEIDAERDLGVGDKTSFRIDSYWRFARRHKIRVMYFDLSRSQTHVISRDITFNGETFSINNEVSSKFDTTILEGAYEYAFVQNDTWELAGSAGIHDLAFKTRLAAAGGAVVASTSTTVSANGPLPVVGLHGIWKLTDSLSIDGEAQFFKINVSPYDGRLENFTGALLWHPIKNVGLGAGYDYFLTRVQVDSHSFQGSLRWRYGGARVFVNASF